MPEVPKYDGTSDPHEHITTYTTTVKENDLAPHEIESMLLKKFGETLTKGDLTCHRTGDCRHLREEVATLLKNGHLREFLSNRAKNSYGRNRDNEEASKTGEEPTHHTINMIFRGNEINGVTFLTTKKLKVSITHSKRLWEDDITFTEEDADGLLLPHNDALAISLNVLDFKIKRILVDPGSSANIIQWRVLEQDKLTRSSIPATKLCTSVTSRGEILMLMNAE
uniref:Uncharacterized protein LOC104227123 n=1 Tax=Nicotiana sylvestris TaxID=4096 RepID=A0A1U7WG05_NICSY|nr:PREDICTED: uncharacterized protein LOC104227123 [Nicotiana sylvestris]